MGMGGYGYGVDGYGLGMGTKKYTREHLYQIGVFGRVFT